MKIRMKIRDKGWRKKDEGEVEIFIAIASA